MNVGFVYNCWHNHWRKTECPARCFINRHFKSFIHASALLSVDILHDLQCLFYYHSLDSFVHSTYAARVTTAPVWLRSRDEPRLDFAVAAARMEIVWYSTVDFVAARESGERALLSLRIRSPDFHQCCSGNALNIYPADAYSACQWCCSRSVNSVNVYAHYLYKL